MCRFASDPKVPLFGQTPSFWAYSIHDGPVLKKVLIMVPEKQGSNG